MGNFHLELVRSQSGKITLLYYYSILLYFFLLLYDVHLILQWIHCILVNSVILCKNVTDRLIICCSELHLATTWPRLTEGLVVDNDVYR